MRWSIIIPVLNDVAALSACLAELQSLRGKAEIIVVDGGSNDGSPEVAAGHCDLVLACNPGRGEQMNYGAREARGKCLLFLHADSVLSRLPDVDCPDSNECSWGFFPVEFSVPHWHYRMLGFFMNKRSAWSHVATGDQGIFVRRTLFETLSGYAPIPLMEDVELCKRLRQYSAPCIQTQSISASPRRWQLHGFIKTLITMWYLRLLYVLGVNPARLAGMYYG